MRILVTGGAGFVGSHICDMLLEQNHEVHVVDSLVAGVANTPLGVSTARKCDLLSFKGGAFDYIVHAAARADVSDNWKNRKERDRLIDTNVLGTAELLEVTRGVPVVFLSTLAVYGDNTSCQESDACIATSPYAASKLAGEALVQAYAYFAGTPWHVFRLGCVAGSRYHHGHVADFVAKSREARKSGVAFQPCNDGLTRKSFVHVLDVVSAVRLAISGELGSGIYNTAGGPWSPRETIRVMGADDLVDWPVDKIHGWIGDPMAAATASRLKNNGWLSRHSIESGIRDALKGFGWES